MLFIVYIIKIGPALRNKKAKSNKKNSKLLVQYIFTNLMLQQFDGIGKFQIAHNLQIPTNDKLLKITFKVFFSAIPLNY